MVNIPRVLLRTAHVTALSAEPRVLTTQGNVKSTPAVFGDSIFNAVVRDTSSSSTTNSSSTFTRHAEWQSVFVEETNINGEVCVVVGPDKDRGSNNNRRDDTTSSNSRKIITSSLLFGRATDNQAIFSDECPALGLGKLGWYDKNPRRFPHAKFGVVAAVLDGNGRILLTRRASHMRSFPSAWVMPGGGVDSGDDSIAASVTREVFEETGLVLDPTSILPIGLWESCYPTSTAACVDAGTGISAHYLALFCVARVAATTEASSTLPCHPPTINLQEEETDLAVWLTPEQVGNLAEQPVGISTTEEHVQIAAQVRSKEETNTPAQSSIPLSQLAGIYPRGNALCGIAQGNLFMLEEMLRAGAGSQFAIPCPEQNTMQNIESKI